MNDRIRIKNTRVLSQTRFLLTETTLDYRRSDGRWETLSRESYDHGNGVAVLLCDRRRRSVVLVRQFRYSAYANGHDGFLIEVCAGFLDDADPATRVLLEAEEETGYRPLPDTLRKVYDLYMTPGSVTERLSLFIAEIDAAAPVGRGGGLADEQEDIEVLEIPFEQALTLVEEGIIVDAKTVLLLQHAALQGVFDS